MDSNEQLLDEIEAPQSNTTSASILNFSQMRRSWTFILVLLSSSIMTGLLFLALWPFSTTFLGALFWDQGFFGPSVTWIAFYAIASLLFQLIQVCYQKRWLQQVLLPKSIGERIDFSNATRFLNHVQTIDGKSESLVAHRLKSGLRNFIAKKSSQEVSDVLSNQAEIDAHNSHASLSTVRLIIWMLPILGFIGTVYGIGGSVSGFSGAINAGSNIDAIKDSLGDVTTGLGTSFNTTLLALILSIAVMIPKNIVQKSSETFLVEVELYCHQHLCQRLEDLITADSNPAEFVDAFEKVLCHYQSTWSQQCSQLASELGLKLANEFNTQFNSYQNANESLFRSLSELATTTSRESATVSQSLHRLQQDQAENLSPLIESIKSTAKTVDRQFSSIQPKLKLGTEQLELLSQFQNKLQKGVADQFKELHQAVVLVGDKLAQTPSQNNGAEEISNAIQKQSVHIVKELRALRNDLEKREKPRQPQEASHATAPRHRSFISHLFLRDNSKMLNGGASHGAQTSS